MARFRHKNKASELADVVKSERAQLIDFEKQLEVVRQRWSQAQEGCSHLAALMAAAPATYSAASEAFFHQYQKELEQRTLESMKRRDDLVTSLPTEARALKDRIERRVSIVRAMLTGFIDAVAGHPRDGGQKLQCDEALLSELAAARQKATESQDIGELVALAESTAELVESSDVPFIPLLRVDASILKALEQ